MKRPLVWSLAVLVAAAGAAWWWASRSGPRRPNVLLISIDTCRADRMGFLGGGRFLADGRSPTPNLDRLALECPSVKEGLSPVPLTLPAHVAMMSGLYPDASGVRENDSFVVPPKETRGYSLLAEDLRAAGYDTAAFVSGQPLERTFGLGAGFRKYEQPTREDDPTDDLRFRERLAEETTDDVLRHLASAGRGPWFLFVHYFDPHHPYVRRPGHEGLPPGPEGAYLSEIMAVDAQIGRLLAALPEGGRDTLIIVAGDHGEGLGEHGEETHGYLLHEAALRVPFLVKPPRGVRVRGLDALPGRLVDIRPTVLAVTGAPKAVESRDDGRSLLDPAPEGWTSAAETLYPFYQFHYARARALQDAAKTKLIEDGGTTSVFDLARDPGESSELGPAGAQARERLEGALRRHLSRPLPGRASDRDVVPSAAVPYFGGRPRTFAIEPGEDENRKLPRVSERWTTIGDLDRARRHIRDREPAKALPVLARHADEAASNPSVLFWTARAEDLAGRDAGLGTATRLKHFERAEAAYEKHAQAFDDGRGTDALIRLRYKRWSDLTQAPDDLEAALRTADGEINRGRGRPLTYALRALAREASGDKEGALEDFREAARRDPDDPRYRRDVERLKAKIAGNP